MKFMSYTEVEQGLGAALAAAQRAPVVITKQSQDVAVLLSVSEYNKLRSLRLDVLVRVAAEIAAEVKAHGSEHRAPSSSPKKC